MARKTFREIVDALKAAPKPLRGSAKLNAALDEYGIGVDGRICLDVGASTGGFTTVLLERGAVRVYAVDAGHGQLLGSLRQHPRVVNLEATNVGDLDRMRIPEAVEIVTIDVSYLPLRDAVSQLDRIDIAVGAELIGLVKPMFELALPNAPTDGASLDDAMRFAADGIAAAGWTVLATRPSPHPGAKGAIEGFIRAKR